MANLPFVHKPRVPARDSTRPRKRLSRLTRTPAASLPGFSPTQRDIAIVDAVYDYRALTTEQIAALFFSPTTLTKCDGRLRRLFDYHFLRRTEQLQSLSDGRKPLVHWLDLQGAEEVAHQRGVDVSALDWQPDKPRISQWQLDHLLDTNWVRIAFVLAARQEGWIVADWRDDLTLKRQHRPHILTLKREQYSKKHRVEPDGYGVLTRFISEGKEDVLRFFLELDRKTVIGQSEAGYRDIGTKIDLYGEFFRPGGVYESYYGTRAGRLLWVTIGEKRLANLKRIVETHGGKSRYWFTTLALATTQNVLTAPIWQIAGRNGIYAFVGTM